MTRACGGGGDESMCDDLQGVTTQPAVVGDHQTNVRHLRSELFVRNYDPRERIRINGSGIRELYICV